MEKEFVPYELAVKLKALGFDWPCYAYIYTGDTGNNYDHYLEVKPSDAKDWNGKSDLCVSRPTFQQAFRWFREKYTTKGWVTPIVNVDGFSDIHEARIHQEESSVLVLGNYDSYESAEFACIEKLIEIVEK